VKSILAGIIATAALALTADAQEASKRSEQAAPPAANEPYQPSIGDIMARQQMRHIKLWFAGSGGNWPLADYELDGLKGGFETLNNLLGGRTVDDAVGAALSALEKAVDAKDRTGFSGAFAALTAGCNSCHHTLGHEFIVIQRPTSQPYSDQVLTTPK